MARERSSIQVSEPIAVRALDHLVLNVRDLEVTVGWYERVLGMTRREYGSAQERPSRVSLVFGEQKINVRPVATDKSSWFTADNATAGSDDLCFLTEADPDRVVAHLAACGVEVEVGPIEREGARGRLMSVYCRDPDGNLIEIASYRAK
jgi:catechol 2,3-dioxygenase-like lactoylglutathione lyase family enzyme